MQGFSRDTLSTNALSRGVGPDSLHRGPAHYLAPNEPSDPARAPMQWFWPDTPVRDAVAPGVGDDPLHRGAAS